MSILLTFVVAINASSLGWSITSTETKRILTTLFQTSFSLYLLIVTGSSVNQRDVESHTRSIIHITSLTIVVTGLFCVAGIMPNSTFDGISRLEIRRDDFYATSAIYVVLLVVAMTRPLGPKLHFPSERIYSEKTVMAITNKDEENVCGLVGASIWDTLLFSYTTKVVMLGNIAQSLDIGDLPIVPGNMRATMNFAKMRHAMREIKFKLPVGRERWSPKTGTGWNLAYRLLVVNILPFTALFVLAAISALLFYTPAVFLQRLVKYLEEDGKREDMSWGWVWVVGLFVSNAITFLITGQLWSLSTTTIQVRLRIQLNSILFAKTLVRKDVASSAPLPPPPPPQQQQQQDGVKSKTEEEEKKDDENDFSTKAQIMTLMTTDVDRVSEFAWHLFSLVDSPIEIAIGTFFLYHLLGVSCFFGLAVTCLFLPLNHFAGKVVVGAQENLMKARDERVALMNEILGGIRMLKFMAWERNFEARVLKVREKELKFQKLNYTIETLWNAIWNGSPILVTLVSFWHYAVVRRMPLTPNVAFTSVSW
ncbi:hypothetical protein Ac2012v2_006548 [Leucoagaricus gongylophorus]